MERKNIRLRRDEILRTRFLKAEYRRIILKSIIKTRELAPLTRFYANNYLQKTHAYLGR